MTKLGHQLSAAWDKRTDTSADALPAVRITPLDTPVMNAFLRINRTLQEACRQRMFDVCEPLQDELLAALAVAGHAKARAGSPAGVR